MDAATVNAKDFVDDTRPVIDSASLVAAEAARVLRAGGAVVVSFRGLRGALSSFFSVILSSVAEALHNDFESGRFDVQTDTRTQRMIYQRSLHAFLARPRP